MNINEVHRLAAKMQVKLFKRSNSNTVGGLKSNFRGTGLQFKEHRLYEPGDEIRFIDWKASARKSEPLIKTFEEERNVKIVCLIDCSPSMLLGSNGVTKMQAAIEICSLFILVSQQTNDFILPIILAGDVHVLDFCKGQAGLIKFIKGLEKLEILNNEGRINRYFYSNEKTFQSAQSKILPALKGRREIIVITDLLDGMDINFIKTLKRIRHVHCFNLKTEMDGNNKKIQSLPSSLTQNSGYQIIRSGAETNEISVKGVVPIHMDGTYLDQVAHALNH